MDPRWLLWVLVACATAYLAVAVPRLTNYLLSDTEFSGWTGPIARRLVGGARLYDDTVLPLPPGSFVLLGVIQQASGKAVLMQEQTVAAVSHVLMALLAYAIVRPFSSRFNAALVATCTFVTVVQMHKELVYDHTAQLLCWSSLAVGAPALFQPRGARRTRFWVAAGLLAGFTFAFKQSTATGIAVGWLAAFGFLAYIGRRDGVVRSVLADAGWWSLGLGAGLGFTALLLVSLDVHFADYWQSVFRDGPELKGGTFRIVFNLISHVVRHEAYPASLAFAGAFTLVGLRLARFEGKVSLGDERKRRHEPGTRKLLLYGSIVVIVFAVATTTLLRREQLWGPFVFWMQKLGYVPSFGLVFLVAFIVGPLARPDADEEQRHGASALSAIAIAALSASLFHNASFPGFRPFYDNNAIIPIAYLCLFLGLERSRLEWLKVALFSLAVMSLMGQKFDRASRATIPIGPHGDWAGMWINERGHEVVRAALRIRELTRDDDTVLVLPEDVQLAALIGRPRPPLRGAIVFVDQYPSRLLEDDLRTLERNLPKVIVIHPRERKYWRDMFELWSSRSAAQHFILHVEDRLLRRFYRLDSTYRTAFARQRATLEVWVRAD